MTIHQESLPWHVTYAGFTGTLPEIRTLILLLHGIAFTVELTSLGVSCEFGISSDNPRGTAALGAGGVITGLNTAHETAQVTKSGGSLFCPGRESFIGNASITLLGNTAAISVRLI